MATLVTLGLLVELVAAAAIVGLALLERRRIAGWCATSDNPESSQKAAAGLFEPARGIATEMAEAVQVRSTLDEALSKAVVRACSEAWSLPAPAQAILHAGAVLLVMTPFGWALLQTAEVVQSNLPTLQQMPESARYLSAHTALEPAFEALRGAARSAAILWIGLAAVWSLGWWLRRPEVREARFVRGLLEVATRIRPGTAAPVSGRLATLLAPDRTLRRPMAAAGLWAGAITAAWLILYGTGDVRLANAERPYYRVWPTENPNPLTLSPDLALPTGHAGAPFAERGNATLTLGAMQVLLRGRPIAEIEEGRLGAGWPPPASRIDPETLAPGPEVTVIAHEAVRVSDGMLPVLGWLKSRAEVERFHLVIRRPLEANRAVQAELPLTFASGAGAGLSLRVDRSGVRTTGARFGWADPAFRDKLRGLVRGVRDLYAAAPPRPVEITVDEGVTIGQLVRVMSVADESCASAEDCGLPGLGLRFDLRASPSP